MPRVWCSGPGGVFYFFFCCSFVKLRVETMFLAPFATFAASPAAAADDAPFFSGTIANSSS